MGQRTQGGISARAGRFLKPFLQDLPGPVQRLVGEMSQGMLASGRCLLSAIGRSIKDRTSLPHREKRFSRGLDRPGDGEEILRFRRPITVYLSPVLGAIQRRRAPPARMIRQPG